MGRIVLIAFCAMAIALVGCASSEHHHGWDRHDGGPMKGKEMAKAECPPPAKQMDRHDGPMMHRPMDGRQMDRRDDRQMPAHAPMMMTRPAAAMMTMGPVMGAMASDAGKAEVKRHMTAMEDMMKQVKTLRDAVQKDIQGGTAADKAQQAHMADAKALAAKIVAENATHVANMAKIVQDESAKPEAVNKLAEMLVKPMGHPMARPEGPKPPEKK